MAILTTGWRRTRSRPSYATSPEPTGPVRRPGSAERRPTDRPGIRVSPVVGGFTMLVTAAHPAWWNTGRSGGSSTSVEGRGRLDSRAAATARLPSGRCCASTSSVRACLPSASTTLSLAVVTHPRTSLSIVRVGKGHPDPAWPPVTFVSGPFDYLGGPSDESNLGALADYAIDRPTRNSRRQPEVPDFLRGVSTSAVAHRPVATRSGSSTG